MISEKKLQQCNIELSPWIIKEIRSDAKRLGKSFREITEAALRQFFSMKAEFRTPALKGLPPKLTGRNL
jgi:hypothetical protein